MSKGKCPGGAVRGRRDPPEPSIHTSSAVIDWVEPKSTVDCPGSTSGRQWSIVKAFKEYNTIPVRLKNKLKTNLQTPRFVLLFHVLC